MLTTGLVVLSAAVGFLVVWVEGLQPFAIWNLCPVALVLFLVRRSERARSEGPKVRAALVVFCVSALALVALLHLAWAFDWGGTATGSSTAALIFIFAPVYTLVLAGAAAAVVWVGLMAAGRLQGSA